jgi:hypothetical protein
MPGCLTTISDSRRYGGRSTYSASGGFGGRSAYAEASVDGVGKDGFEPPNSEEDRFTVCCRWPLGYLPDRAREGTRTPDQLITNQLLYQLSYSGVARLSEIFRQAHYLFCAKNCWQYTALPYFFGKAKVNEFGKSKNLIKIIFCACSQHIMQSISLFKRTADAYFSNIVLRCKNKKASRRRRGVYTSSFSFFLFN